MSARALAATLLAAISIAIGPHVRAADLYGEYYDPPSETDEYEDGAYGECGDREPCDEALRPESYGEYGDDEDAPYEGRNAMKDGRSPPRPRYGERSERAEGPCLPRWEIKRRLHSEGWSDLRPVDRDGPVVSVKARRRFSGRQFVLDIDRCTGDIVDARPAFLRTFGAYERPHWRAPY